jgi:hypothetical protein
MGNDELSPVFLEVEAPSALQLVGWEHLAMAFDCILIRGQSDPPEVSFSGYNRLRFDYKPIFHAGRYSPPRLQAATFAVDQPTKRWQSNSCSSAMINKFNYDCFQPLSLVKMRQRAGKGTFM